MKPSMVDTDILSEFFRGNSGVMARVDEHITAYGYISLSIITYYEILNGLFFKDAKKQLLAFREFASLNKIIPLTIPMAEKAAEIEAYLRKQGAQIGHADTLIAGTAIISNLQLVTNNTEHFKRIDDLLIDNWLL